LKNVRGARGYGLSNIYFGYSAWAL